MVEDVIFGTVVLNKTRRKILDYIIKHPYSSMRDIREGTGYSSSTIRQSLFFLRKAGYKIERTIKEDEQVYYIDGDYTHILEKTKEEDNKQKNKNIKIGELVIDYIVDEVDEVINSIINKYQLKTDDYNLVLYYLAIIGAMETNIIAKDYSTISKLRTKLFELEDYIKKGIVRKWKEKIESGRMTEEERRIYEEVSSRVDDKFKQILSLGEPILGDENA